MNVVRSVVHFLSTFSTEAPQEPVDNFNCVQQVLEEAVNG